VEGEEQDGVDLWLGKFECTPSSLNQNPPYKAGPHFSPLSYYFFVLILLVAISELLMSSFLPRLSDYVYFRSVFVQVLVDLIIFIFSRICVVWIMAFVCLNIYISLFRDIYIIDLFIIIMIFFLVSIGFIGDF
jgi:hypothetical protein